MRKLKHKKLFFIWLFSLLIVSLLGFVCKNKLIKKFAVADEKQAETYICTTGIIGMPEQGRFLSNDISIVVPYKSLEVPLNDLSKQLAAPISNAELCCLWQNAIRKDFPTVTLNTKEAENYNIKVTCKLQIMPFVWKIGNLEIKAGRDMRILRAAYETERLS